MFDELVRTLPDGVFLNSIEQRGVNLTINGVAQSSARVSGYMRAIEASEYLAINRLDLIQSVMQERDRAQQFVLQAKQISPNAAAKEDAE